VKAVNVQDFSKMYSVSRSTVEKAIREKQLNSFRRGRRIFIFIEDGEKWIKGEVR
jgi:hypothetical protein